MCSSELVGVECGKHFTLCGSITRRGSNDIANVKFMPWDESQGECLSSTHALPLKFPSTPFLSSYYKPYLEIRLLPLIDQQVFELLRG